MTISAIAKTRIGPFVGNGVMSRFAVPNLPSWAVDSVQVWTNPVGDRSAAIRLTENTDYTVGVGEVVLSAPLASTDELLLITDIEIKQDTDLTSQGRFFPETHETAWDYLTLLVKQIAADLYRVADFDTPTADPIITVSKIVIDGVDYTQTMQQLVTDAGNSAIAAAQSESNASSSEGNALLSELAAAQSAREAADIAAFEVVQESGQSTAKVMSQKAVTDALGAVSGAAASIVDAKVLAHDHNPAAHPELSAFISGEADRAEAAKVRAETILVEVERAVNLDPANIYVDVATGLASTVDAENFWVLPNEGDDIENLTLYTNNDSEAVKLYELYNLNQFMAINGEEWV